MAEVQIPEGASAKDTTLLALSIVVLLGGIVAFYWYDELPLPVRVLMVFAGLGGAAGLMWFSWYGREFWQFAIASRTELRKVVWPEREDTVKTTIVIFAFTAFMAVFFWLLDLLLTWLTRLLSGVS
jgi:preprotein translocase subunit SecE